MAAFGAAYRSSASFTSASFLIRAARRSGGDQTRAVQPDERGLVLAAGFVTGPIDWLLWGGAIAVQVATPFLAPPTADSC
jgi:hypothetical protein